MLANLNTSALTDAATANARCADLLKLWTGQITNVAGLNSAAWDTTVCTVNSTVPGNWSII